MDSNAAGRGPKTPLAPAVMAFFHSETCIGWISKSWAICWMVWMSFGAYGEGSSGPFFHPFAKWKPDSPQIGWKPFSMATEPAALPRILDPRPRPMTGSLDGGDHRLDGDRAVQIKGDVGQALRRSAVERCHGQDLEGVETVVGESGRQGLQVQDC